MVRRKTVPEALRPAWGAFAEQAQRVEQARRAVLRCLPVGRVQPAPVTAGLGVLRAELAVVAAAMPAWRVPEVASQWQACRAAVDQSLRALERAHRAATDAAELEELLSAVADVVHPLDVWGEAERRWRALRVRR